MVSPHGGTQAGCVLGRPTRPHLPKQPLVTPPSPSLPGTVFAGRHGGLNTFPQNAGPPETSEPVVVWEHDLAGVLVKDLEMKSWTWGGL